MPEPRKGESQSDYISRAISQLRREGRPEKQAIAIAYSMWRERRKKRRQKKFFANYEAKGAYPIVQAPMWDTKAMAVSPALSSVDQTAGAAFREMFHFGLKPFHRRKLKKKTDLKRNEPALVPEQESTAKGFAVEPKALVLEEVDARTKDLGPGWSYKYAADQLHGYGLDLTLQGPPQYDEEAMSITFPFAASHGRDRVGDFLDVGGIDTANHRRNPVAFVDHGKWSALPIGKCEDPQGNYTVTIDEDRGLALATVFLDRDPKHVVPQQVFSLFKQGILRAGSIGYRPLNSPKVLPPVPEKGIPRGVDLDRVELLEVTICGLPANGDAVRRVLEDGWEGRAWEPQVKAMLESQLAD